MKISNRSVTHFRAITLGIALLSSACGSDDKKASSDALGGSSATGGSSAGGSSGGLTGGSTSKSTSSGGVATTGGLSGTGGIANVGGTSSTAATSATGGNSSTNTSATGGKASTGGVTSAAGAAATGGASATGGSVSTTGGTSSATGGASAVGGASATGGTTSTSTTTAACNSLDLNGAPTVTPVSLAQVSPAPSGGTIANGVYYQTAEITYTGVGGSTTNTATPFKSAISVSGNTITQLGSDGTQSASWTMTINISGSAMTTQAVCGPAPNAVALGYSASSTVLKVYITKGSETQENTFTLKT